METFVIVAYCSCDDARKKIGYKDNSQTKVGVAQIMTTALVAARFFGGNQNLAQQFLYQHKYFHYRLSASRFNRRLHAVSKQLWDELVRFFTEYAKRVNESFEFAIDSFPIPVCDNIRINQSKLFAPKGHRGKIASKKRFFHGVKVHMISTINRLPAEFVILPGGVSDSVGAKKLDFNLPVGSIVYADKGYNDYKHEDSLRHDKYIDLQPIRKSNSKRQYDLPDEMLIKRKRKSVETAFSSIVRLLPKSIHAVTSSGFLKKVMCFVLAYSASLFR